MLRKITVIFEYFYFVVALFFLYKTYELWNTDEQSRAYLFLFFAGIAIFMFFFRRNFRRRVEKRMKDRE